MPRYLRKKYKRNEKKMVSTRVKTYVLDAFQNAAEDANNNGYILSLSEIVESALIQAISEYKEEKVLPDIAFPKNSKQERMSPRCGVYELKNKSNHIETKYQ